MPIDERLFRDSDGALPMLGEAIKKVGDMNREQSQRRVVPLDDRPRRLRGPEQVEDTSRGIMWTLVACGVLSVAVALSYDELYLAMDLVGAACSMFVGAAVIYAVRSIRGG